MQSYTGNENASFFLNNLHGMIDSKIQYLEYRLSLSYDQLKVDVRTKPHSPISSPESKEEIKESLNDIEDLNRKVQMLLYLKSKIDVYNAESASKTLYHVQLDQLKLEEIDKII